MRDQLMVLSRHSRLFENRFGRPASNLPAAYRNVLGAITLTARRDARQNVLAQIRLKRLS